MILFRFTVGILLICHWQGTFLGDPTMLLFVLLSDVQHFIFFVLFRGATVVHLVLLGLWALGTIRKFLKEGIRIHLSAIGPICQSLEH